MKTNSIGECKLKIPNLRMGGLMSADGKEGDHLFLTGSHFGISFVFVLASSIVLVYITSRLRVSVQRDAKRMGIISNTECSL